MPFHPVSPRFWLARQTELGLTAFVLLILAVAAGIAIDRGWAVIPAAIVIVWFSVAWFVERGRYRAWGYAERDEDLIVTRGLLFKRISVVPYGRMQFIDVTAGPMDRLFGLATVQLHTAAAASDARIPGLLLTDAQALRDRLATVGEARSTGL